MQGINKEYSEHDMASIGKSIPEFHGLEEEDVFAWSKGAKLIAHILGLSDEILLKHMLVKLRGHALNWAVKTLELQPDMQLNSFLQQLHERFANTEKTHKILEEFLQTKSVSSRNEYLEMLKKGEYLIEKNCLNTVSAIKLIIARAPIVLKPILLQVASTSNSWEAFIKLAQDTMWIAFDQVSTEQIIIENRNIMRTQGYHTKKEGRNYGKKSFCKLHGNCNHDTPNCRLLKQLEEAGYSVVKKERRKINNVRNDEVEVEKLEELNKYKSIYSVNKNINPFTIKISTNEGTHEGIIDTGADVSLINKNNIPKGIQIKKCTEDINIYSACGNQIKVIGEVEIQITINYNQYHIKALVIEGNPSYTLLGADMIIKFPTLLNVFREQTQMKINMATTQKIEDIVEKYSSIFKTEISELNLCSLGKHKITLTDGNPVRQRHGRVPIHLEKQINDEINKNLKLGIIKESESPWCARIVPVIKPNGQVRMCIDYRALNQKTIKDTYPLPRVDEILDSLGKAKYFSTLDATSGYYQIAMQEEDRSKTAFAWKNGLYEFTRMPFGLCNAPATFQRTIDKIFKEENGIFVLAYLDDIIVFSNSEEEHKTHLDIVLGKIKASGLSLNMNKCKFNKREIEILGHVISNGKVKPHPDKIKAIREYTKPNKVKDLRAFLGLANYCRDFISNYAHVSAPLCNLLKGESKRSIRTINWSEEANEAFTKLKKEISNITYRSQPDFKKDFIVTTDASNIAISAILAQKDIYNKERIIHTFSRKLNDTEKNYSITDKELLAVVKGLEYFKHYLLGKEFILKTDHSALQYLWSTNNSNARLMRWALKLQEYSFSTEYIKGENNAADCLSRPCNVLNIKNSHSNKLKIQEPATKCEIIREYHLKTGHGSINNLNFLIRKKYYWNGMGDDIKEFINKCRICALTGDEGINTKNRVIETAAPNELWVIDLIGRLRGSDGKSKFILVAIDHYTKWTETKLLNSKTAEESAKAIQELIISKHGVPKRILSDNGLEFNNQETKKLCIKYGIKWTYNSPRHHESVGAVERVNQTLMRKLKRLSNIFNRNWESYLNEATYAVNISYNRAIRTSPMIIKYGTIPDLEIDTKLNVTSQTEPILEVRDLRDRNFSRYAEKGIQKGKRVCKNNLEIGDSVAIYVENIGNKLSSNWHEGYRVIEKVPPDAYMVQNKKSKLRVNKKHIKKIFF